MQSVNLLLISIHAPRTGSDQKRSSAQGFKSLFQSTLPARGATGTPSSRAMCAHFNPRSPHGERRRGALTIFVRSRFQSTLPARGATRHVAMGIQQILISIHAPRTGSDRYSASVRRFSLPFQSTLPARGATWYPTAYYILILFQSTLPARGATPNTRFFTSYCVYFNPRSPHGERHEADKADNTHRGFQSTLPARGATSRGLSGVRHRQFQSTLPARGATLGFFID